MNLLVILLITVLYICINAVIAGINNGTARYKPFKDMFKKQGMVIQFNDNMPLVYQGGAKTEEIIKDLGFPEGYEYFTVYEITTPTDSKISVHLAICDDDFLKKLKFPVKARAKASKNAISVCVPENNQGLDAGSEFKLPLTLGDKVLKVTTLYSGMSYVPTLGYYSAFHEDYTAFYGQYDINNPDCNIPYVLVKKSDIPELEDYLIPLGAAIYYPEEISEENYSKFSDIMYKWSGYFEFKTLDENSKILQKDTFLKYMPILILAAIAVTFGFCCCISVKTMQDLHTMGIFRICGMNKKQCVCIQMLNILYITLTSLLIAVIFLKFFSSAGMDSKLGLIYSWYNIAITIAFILLFILIGTIISVKVIYSRKPQETLRETFN